MALLSSNCCFLLPPPPPSPSLHPLPSSSHASHHLHPRRPHSHPHLLPSPTAAAASPCLRPLPEDSCRCLVGCTTRLPPRQSWPSTWQRNSRRSSEKRGARGGGWRSGSSSSSSSKGKVAATCSCHATPPPSFSPSPLFSSAHKMADVYDALADRLLAAAERTKQGEKYLIALAGPPGAGKSTVGREAVLRANAKWRQQRSRSGVVGDGEGEREGKERREGEGEGEGEGAEGEGVVVSQQDGGGDGDDVAVDVPMDGFHLYRWQLDQMKDPNEAHARRGAPWTFDAKALFEDLKRIRTTGTALLPSFDHAVGDPIERDILVKQSARVVLVEGNYLLLDLPDWADVSSLFDEKWFLHVDIDEAMRRVTKRHMGTGDTLERAQYRVAYNDRPNAELIMQSSSYADIVIPSLPF